jgi:hypothetical protein
MNEFVQGRCFPNQAIVSSQELLTLPLESPLPLSSMLLFPLPQILEEIRAGLEDISGGLANHQRRVAQMRFLGELYNYRIIDSPIIFETLYLLLNYGYGTPQVMHCVNCSQSAFHIYRIHYRTSEPDERELLQLRVPAKHTQFQRILRSNNL